MGTPAFPTVHPGTAIEHDRLEAIIRCFADDTAPWHDTEHFHEHAVDWADANGLMWTTTFHPYTATIIETVAYC